MRILLTILALIYLLNPFDLVSDFLPGWGWLDDGFILFLLWKYIYQPWIRQKQQERYHQSSSHQFHENQHAQYGKREDPKDPYTVLGIGKNATRDEIKSAYKKLVNKYHPDKVQYLGEEFRQLAEKRFKEIQDAYQQLK